MKVDCSITVVDNSGDVGELGVDVDVVRPTSNLGYAGAVNVVLSRWLGEAEGDVFIAACHDCVLADDSIRRLISAMYAHPRVGIVGFGARGPEGHMQPSPWVSGTCLGIKRQCAQEIGLFDEQLGTYDEDVDYCLRAWDAGWKVVAVGGAAPATLGSIATDRTERIARNHVLLAAKRRGVAGALVEFAIQVRHGVSGVVAQLAAKRLPGGLPLQRLRGAASGLCQVSRQRGGRPTS